VALGAAPWHGRLLVLDRDNAGESTGHGSPLPHTTHDGPGRAGGGEELGGLRSVLHHMQRTAVQAHPDLLAALIEETRCPLRQIDIEALFPADTAVGATFR
jgi:oxepin-CoA hydrolase/3-oxo-5,6-dehydrosuberyl-CoA semialdehyde dehydrogenase